MNVAAQIRLRGLSLILGVASVVSLGSLQSAAQEPAKGTSNSPEKAAATKKATDPSRRVPPFFGKIGLSPDQKEEIYKVRAKHQVKIDALQKQLATARAEMISECELKLTEAQAKALLGLRSAAEAKRAKAAVAPKVAIEKGANESE